ncbi:MAG: MFS transporter, partial [Ktedonobacterales bacterium]
LLTPGSLAIISASFNAEQRGRAIGTWSGFTAITTALGPVLGGWLVQAASWRWVFFINVPLAIIVLAITLTRVPESRDDSAKRLDWRGALLATLGLGGVVFGLISSSARGLSDPLVVGTVLLGVAALVAFVLVEQHSAEPMMPLYVFQSRTFSGANLLTLLLYAALSAATFFLPFNLIQVQGYPPAAAGAAFLPFVLLMFLLSRWSGGLVARYGAKLPLVIGPLIAAAGFALFAVPDIGGSYWVTFFPAVVVLGLGMAVTVAPLTTAVMGAVSQQHAGVASGINNAVSRTAGLLAIAVLGIVLLAAFTPTVDSHLAALHLTPAVRQALAAQHTQLAAATIPDSVTGAARAAVQRALGEAFVAGFRAVMLVCVGLAIASSAGAAALVEGPGLRLSRRAKASAA